MRHQANAASAVNAQNARNVQRNAASRPNSAQTNAIETRVNSAGSNPVMARSLVAAEDANFCQHWGFDMAAIRDAIDGGGTRGASTLSQQTVKNVFLWHGRSWPRKALEAALTPVVELLWSKRRIVEVYLNVAEFDEGVFGVEAASRHYFGVSAADLSAVQAARLAITPRSFRQYAIVIGTGCNPVNAQIGALEFLLLTETQTDHGLDDAVHQHAADQRSREAAHRHAPDWRKATGQTRLYVGPKLQHVMEKVAPGLELTVDYGKLTFLAKPIFWLLEKIHALVGNWGWAIIIFTILLKLIFYKLSETSYRSMAKMKKFTPRIQALKDRYAALDTAGRSRSHIVLCKVSGLTGKVGLIVVCDPIQNGLGPRSPSGCVVGRRFGHRLVHDVEQALRERLLLGCHSDSGLCWIASAKRRAPAPYQRGLAGSISPKVGPVAAQDQGFHAGLGGQISVIDDECLIVVEPGLPPILILWGGGPEGIRAG